METILGPILGLVVLLIARELVCSYWKINRALELLEEINTSLKQIAMR